MMNRLQPQALALAITMLLGGCASLAPSYQRPAAPVPAQWAAGTPAVANADNSTLPDWHTLVLDQRLRQTITLALDNSRPLRLAVLAIAQAQATYRVQDAASWPTVKGSAGLSATRLPGQANSNGQPSTSSSLTAGLGISAYELDLFGRVKSLQDAALENYLATQDAQRSTRLALVAQVANSWLTLGADQALLSLASSTLASQRKTLALTQRRVALGADTALTLAQVQSSVQTARRDLATATSQLQQDRNALDLLVGAPVPDALLPPDQPEPSAAQLVAVPAGLPSTLLQRRPDVLAAEHQLKAANADIGAARAALYPSISLTGSLGTASRNLSDLFKGGAWSLAPSISLPILDGGAAQATLRGKTVARDIQLATYEQTLQTAFREVADALAVRATLDERLAAQQALVDATGRSLTLAQARYAGGATSYLETLDAQRTLYTAQQSLVALRLAEQSNRMTLFKVLGGGWTDTDSPTKEGL